MAVTPGGPARLVEVSPLFVELARDAAGEAWREQGHAHVRRMLSTYFQVAKPKRKTSGEEALFADFAPAQVVALERFLTTIRQTGRCIILTDLDDMLTALSGSAKEDTVEVLADFLGAGGVLVFSTHTAFDWFYARLLRPLILKLGPRSRRLASVLLILSGGTEVFAFEDGAYRLISSAVSRESSGGFDALVGLSKERSLQGMPALDPASTAYIADSRAPHRIDRAMASRVGIVIDVGEAMLPAAGKPIITLHRAYDRTIDVVVSGTAALQESGLASRPPNQPEVGETVLWTFERPHFPPARRLRVRVTGSGFVHAGVADSAGAWNPVYNVPLVPLPEGGYEAVLPSGVNACTFFWTEAPWTPGRPGHWERQGRMFRPRKK